MRTIVRYSAASAVIPVWLLSAAILISGVHLNVAQAQDSPKKHRVAVAITYRSVQRCASARKQHARMSPKGPSETFQKMRCLSEPCCAHV
jgi:hypothetical protein